MSSIVRYSATYCRYFAHIGGAVWAVLNAMDLHSICFWMHELWCVLISLVKLWWRAKGKFSHHPRTTGAGTPESQLASQSELLSENRKALRVELCVCSIVRRKPVTPGSPVHAGISWISLNLQSNSNKRHLLFKILMEIMQKQDQFCTRIGTKVVVNLLFEFYELKNGIRVNVN